MSAGAQHRPVCIVTDSTADLPADLLERYQIVTLPTTVNLGTRSYRHGIDIDNAGFYQMLARSSERPTTAAPTPARTSEVYCRLLDAGFDIVSVHLASSLSSIYDSARQIAADLAPERIRVLDSGQLTTALGLLACAGARLAQAGHSLEEVASHCQRLLPRLRLAGILEDLDFVRRSGRITAVMALIGTILKVRPVFEVYQNRVTLLENTRTIGRAMERLVRQVHAWDAVEALAVIHAHNDPLGQELCRRLAGEMPPSALYVEAGPTIAAHVGPGAIGVAGLLK